MLYLFGDSTESNLDFDFLAFLREVIDATVVLADCEVLLAVTVERRRTRQLDADALIAAVDEFGKHATQLVGPVAKDQTGTPVGRCAATIATAIREAVEREASQVRGALATERDEMDREDQRLQTRAKDALERMLRTHDLPGADKELRVVWTGSGMKATMRQRTSFGIEAVLALDIPASSVLAPDLRVDRIAEGVEVHAFEAGGWLKKSDKLVSHKLGRYQVASITIGSQVTVQLRAAADAGGAGFAVTAHGNGELTLEPTGGVPGREVAIDDRNRPAMRLLVERLEAAARSLGENRAGLVSIEIDGKALAEHGHPRVLAERLMVAIAPTVQNIAKHSRSPGELVLRRLLGDNRREEIFVPVAELLRRFDGLPATARAVFAPLQLDGEAPPLQEHKHLPTPPAEARISAPPPSPPPSPPSPQSPSSSMADPRSASGRPSPPAMNYDRQRPVVPQPEAKRAGRPSAPPPTFDVENDESPFLSSPKIPPAPVVEARSPFVPTRLAAVIVDESIGSTTEPTARKRLDDAAVSKSIEVALDEDDEMPSVK